MDHHCRTASIIENLLDSARAHMHTGPDHVYSLADDVNDDDAATGIACRS